jgi:hypothetical protein
MLRSWWDRFAGMANDTLRSVTLQRTSLGQYEVSNARGGTITVGAGGRCRLHPARAAARCARWLYGRRR